MSSDKLPALSGIIAALQQMVGDTCYAALWKRSFVESLLWQVQIIEPDKTRAKRPNQWRAPSWSFASIDSCTHYPFGEGHASRLQIPLLAKLEECNLVPVNPNNPLGELKSVSETWD
jgi:hypothetical protein